MDQSERYEEDEDVHICGLCRAQFSDVEYFIQHKNTNCPVRIARQQSNQGHDHQYVEQFRPQTSVEEHPEQSIGQSIQTFGQNDLQSSYSTADGQITIQVNKEGNTLGYLQVPDVQTGSQAVSEHNNAVQYATQPEYVEIENDGHNGGMPHEYVLLSGPTAEEAYTGQDNSTEYQPQVTTETVYTLDSHSLQTGVATLTNHTLSDQDTSNFYQAATSHPNQLVAGTVQTGSDNLHLNTSTASYLTETDNQSSLRRILTGSAENGVPSSVHVQDGFISSSDPEQQIQYTLSLGLQGRSQDIDVAELKPNNITQANYDASIQYTLSSMAQNSLGEEGVQIMDIDTSPPRKNRLNEKSSQVPLIKKEVEKRPKAPPEKKYKCTYINCKYRTAYLKDLERHIRIHTGEKPFKCVKCDKSFNRNDKLLLHMRYHLNERTYKCTLCDYSAVENGSLKKHMKIHMDERPFSCQVCPYKSRSSSQLQIHLRIHTGDTPYLCKMCPSMFKVKSDLTRHMRVHTGEKPYQCEYDGCPYRCAIKSNMRSHYRTHHKPELELTCEICEFKTSSKKALFEHKKAHEVIVELICDTCNYQCSNRSALKNHMRLHNVQVPFQCNYCNYKSVQSGNVQSHMKRKHPLKFVKKTRKSKFDILLNVKKKEEEEILPEVKSKKNGNIRTKCPQNYKCDQCSAAFVREDSLKCHLKMHIDGCSSLSTAYAVLKLQQPVINTSTPDSTGSTTVETAGTQTEIYESEATRNSNTLQTLDPKQSPSLHQPEANYHTSGQGSMFQGQTVSLGINDILMAAGMCSLNSSGDSPTLKHQSGQSPFQELQTSESTTVPVSTIVSANSTGEDGVQNVMIGQTLQDVPSVQVMQNISLPYIRLPNGQVLILTGQNPLSQLVTQSDSVPQPDQTLNTAMVQIQPQMYAQQPTMEQHQIIQSPADSTSPTVGSQISSSQQPGAIPIQIILPNDSQQSIPLVSQLLNSVNRGSGDNFGNATIGQSSTVSLVGSKAPGTGGVQTFVVQIPAQSGAAKDSAESQSYVLQIPAPTSLN